MKKTWLIALAITTTLAVAYLGLRERRQMHAQVLADVAAMQRLDQDGHSAALLATLAADAGSGRIAFLHVGLVDPESGTILSDQTVVAMDGKIDWVGPSASAPDLTGALQIDGSGKFLAPGLTDMHVHTEQVGQHLLRLAAGVTSVRDMDGFPWLLRTRDAIDAGAMPGATTYVAGTIIADQPLDGYAVVVHSPEEARQTVRDQVACGYSFIKVHNSLAEPLFDVVADEAQRQKLDLVGHVPHDISLMHAIQSGHMRTLEHLKGFLYDRNYLPSDEPYAPALKGAEVWLTPTLYVRISGAYGNAAQALMADPRQRFNPRARREEWQAGVPAPGSDDAKFHDRLVKTQDIVMARLLPLHPRWLVGTDAAGYTFNIAGFATLDELLLLHQAGLSNADIVRAATSEPAVAMRRPGEFGRIAVGMRADLVLLAANPLADVAAYQSNLGVMARGRWYDRKHLDQALAGLARIYAEPVAVAIDLAAAGRQVEAVEGWAKRGYVFEDAALTAAASALQRKGAVGLSERLRRLLSAPASGVCAVETPG